MRPDEVNRHNSDMTGPSIFIAGGPCQLDEALERTYGQAAARQAAIYTTRGNRRMYWAAIRSDLQRSAAGLKELRTRMAAHPATKVQALEAVTDLRLLDMRTW